MDDLTIETKLELVAVELQTIADDLAEIEKGIIDLMEKKND